MPLSGQQAIAPLIRSIKWSVRFWYTKSRIIYCQVRTGIEGAFIPKFNSGSLTTLFHVQVRKTDRLSRSSSRSTSLRDQLCWQSLFTQTLPFHLTYQKIEAAARTARVYLGFTFLIELWGPQFQTPYSKCDFTVPRYALSTYIGPRYSVLRALQAQRYDWETLGSTPLPSSYNEATLSSHFWAGPDLCRSSTLEWSALAFRETNESAGFTQPCQPSS